MRGLSSSISLMILCQLSSDLLVVTSNRYGLGACSDTPSHVMNGMPVDPTMYRARALPLSLRDPIIPTI